MGNFDRKFDYLHLRNGTHLSLFGPDPKAMNIDVIAHALSNLCRFCGQVDKFYSVAQHSVLVSKLVPAEFALEGLLHDASEAFCGDLPKPIKQHCPDYQAIEACMYQAVAERYGIPDQLSPEVVEADVKALVTEASQLVKRSNDWKTWYPEVVPADEVIIPLTPAEAEKLFLDRYEELMTPEVDEEELNHLIELGYLEDSMELLDEDIAYD